MPRLLLILQAIIAIGGTSFAWQDPATQEKTGGGGVAVPSHRLRIATWNLYNLFDNHDDPNHPDEGTDPKSLVELKVMAGGIDALEADILAVQEVENRYILDRLNRGLKRPFPHLEVVEGNDARGIDVGILSRVPIESVTTHRSLELSGDHVFARDFPVFRVRPAANRWINIGVVHLKSKLGKKTESDAWRRAEADAMAGIIRDLRKHSSSVPFVVLGDFNDFRDAETLAPLFRGLSDVTQGVPPGERYSYVYRGKPQQIDHMLTTGDLKALQVKILHPEHGASDHAPVVADFDVGAEVIRSEAPESVPWTEPERPALDAGDLVGLEANLLQEIVVTGTVTKVHRPKSGSSASLNFHEDYKKAVTAYIPSAAFPRLPALDDLVGRRVSVIGPVCRRYGVYQIRLTRASQLQLK